MTKVDASGDVTKWAGCLGSKADNPDDYVEIIEDPLKSERFRGLVLVEFYKFPRGISAYLRSRGIPPEETLLADNPDDYVEIVKENFGIS